LLELNKIYNMHCIDGMKLLDDNSMDSIVTDPPYELGFMGKSWDSTGIAYNVEMWQECLRVLKPGGFLLSFGGTRTYHRMVCAIEDAGFEIRDQIQWIYGSGFPKSMNISKAIDKAAGVSPLEIKPASGVGFMKPDSDDWNVTKNQIIMPSATTPEAQQWDGWGTALKPAHEPIVVARKPLSEKTVVNNVLKWGTGGINIDGCRVETTDNDKEIMNKKSSKNPTTNYSDKEDKIYGKYAIDKASPANPIGRFPANILLDEEAGLILDEQSGISKSTGGHGDKSKGALGKSVYGKYKNEELATNAGGLGDSGGASRFFYCAKASRKERGEGNTHPTVKPLSLIKYLVTLVTPPKGISLDPFEGSGTHTKACKELEFNYIGFEKEKEYCDIANERTKDKVVWSL